MMNEIEEIQAKIGRMREKFGWQNSDTPVFLAESLLNEANELWECFLRDDLLLEEISGELADVLMYAFTLVKVLDLDLTEIIENKIAIVIKRNYE